MTESPHHEKDPHLLDQNFATIQSRPTVNDEVPFNGTLLYSPAWSRAGTTTPWDQQTTQGFFTAAALTASGIASFFSRRCSNTQLHPLPAQLNSMDNLSAEPWPFQQQHLGLVNPGPMSPFQPELLYSTPYPQLNLQPAAGPLSPAFNCYQKATEIVFGPGAIELSPSRVNVAPMSTAEQRARAALLDAKLTGPGLVEAITERVACLQVDEQRAYIARIASLLSPSVLGAAPPKKTTPGLQIKKKLFSSARSIRQSKRLRELRSKFTSSRRSQAAICAMLGIIDTVDDFNDDTMLDYLKFFKEPIPPAKIAKLTELAGVASPSQLQLPVAELQAMLEELAAA
jgi:hypothetical protein